MEYEDLVAKYKLDMQDAKYGDVIPEKYDLVQPKQDGWWTLLIVENGKAKVITSGGDHRSNIDIEIPDSILIAEWMYGTNFSQTSPLKDNFIIHDVVFFKGSEYRHLPYQTRLATAAELQRIAKNPLIQIIETHPARVFDYGLWDREVILKGNEGLVFKNSAAIFGAGKMIRMKREFTKDYIVCGFKEGIGRLTGTLGALEGGLMKPDGSVVRVLSVGGGFDDSERELIWGEKEYFIGKVFEASGKALFTSGALRHPAFIRFRTDKLAKDCTL